MLAGAFVQRDLATKATGISTNEVDAYIQAHPIQFAKRQLYQIEQISFPPQKDMEALAASTKDFKSLDQVEAKLNELNIKFSRGTGALDTATLPPEIEKAIEARKQDDIFFIRSRTNASFFKVASVDDKPLTGRGSPTVRQTRTAQRTRQEGRRGHIRRGAGEREIRGRLRAHHGATPAAAPAAGGATPAAEGQTGEKPAGEAQKSGEEQKEPSKN